MEAKRTLGRGVGSMWQGALVASGLIVIALAAPAVAHNDGTTSHLWADHIKLMKQPGTINTDSNPVDWTKLKGVPAGLADGVDGGVEAAGFGLNKTGNLFSVDVTEVQRRVAAGCRPGGAILRINQDGGIECQRGSDGLSTVDSDTGTICAIFCTEGALDVGAGRWAIRRRSRSINWQRMRSL